MSIISKIKCAFTLGQGLLIENKELLTSDDPISFFKQWLIDAQDSGIILPESMSLSTCTAQGSPSSRIVLLKKVDYNGFVFFTNYGSRKATELEANPFAALLFHWRILQRQVRIEGCIERISQKESEDYFHSRDRGSQIGAWASYQSQELESRALLKSRFTHFEDQFKNKVVPLPAFWGGYRVIPARIEFWQGKANRLHDRFIYQAQNDSWKITRLNP